MPIDRLNRAVRLLLLLLTGWFWLVLLGLFGLRLAVPFPLEWGEDGFLAYAVHLARGGDYYPSPSVDLVSGIYTPLHAVLLKWVMQLAGHAAAPARLLSIAAFLTAAGCIAFITLRTTGSRLAALLAAGLAAAGYRYTGYFYDLARCDSLFIAFGLLAVAPLAGPDAAGRPPGRWRIVWLAIGLSLALWTKQTAVALATVLLLWLWERDRRAAVAAGVTLAVVNGLLFLTMDRLTDGLLWYYTLTVPGAHPVFPAMLFRSLHRDVLAGLPFLIGLLLAATALPSPAERPRGRLPEYLALAGLAAAMLPRIKGGGYLNSLMPLLLCSAPLAAVAWHRLRSAGGAREAAAGLLLAAQLLLFLYDPAEAVPSRTAVAEGQATIERIGSLGNRVLIPAHPYLAVLAGSPPAFHIEGYLEAYHGGLPELAPERFFARLSAGEWDAIILDPGIGLAPPTLYDPSFYLAPQPEVLAAIGVAAGMLSIAYTCGQPFPYLDPGTLAYTTGLLTRPSVVCLKKKGGG